MRQCIRNTQRNNVRFLPGTATISILASAKYLCMCDISVDAYQAKFSQEFLFACIYIVDIYGMSSHVSLAHACSFPGCGSVLVLDGNMKNHRDVCYAKDAGFIQFNGLPGLIKTGCPGSPDFKSQYCAQHKPLACDLLNSGEVDDELGITPGPALRSQEKRQHPGSPIAEMILAKKTTRKQTYYQVCAILIIQ